MVPQCGFNLFSLTINDVRHPFVCFFAISISSLVKCFSNLSPTFKLACFFPYNWIVRVLTILDIGPLITTWYLQMFFYEYLAIFSIPKQCLWKRPWCWERLRVGGEGDDREWDGWMASPTQWTWDWVDSGSWWWTGRPGVLQFMGSRELEMTEKLNWTELKQCLSKDSFNCNKVQLINFAFMDASKSL